ncbi:MAG: hypothetical protein JWM56_1131 [Candidatus Peribacteria bacterium]|nr:hypothetical protein [Candidatus Peribacteria bacterium]
MTTEDPAAPATKQDIHILMDMIGSYEIRFERIENDIGDMKGEIHIWKQEIMEHFDLVAENIRYDVQGANKDEIEGIKDRVLRLEQHTGLQKTR